MRLRNSYYIESLSEMPLCDQLMSFPEQAEYAMNIDIGDIFVTKKVCIFALGESSIAGEIISAYADDNAHTPVTTISDGRVPAWVDSDTTAILVTYTGENDVINKIYKILHGRRCKIYAISSGGHLKNLCKKNNDCFLQVKPGLSPRSVTGFELGILSSLVQNMGICNAKDRLKELIPVMKEYRRSLFDDPRVNSLEFKISCKTVAVYGSPDVSASFKRWKMSFNTDMGFPAYCGELPEFNHNEIVGWANHNQAVDDLIIIFLRGAYKNDVLPKIVDKTMEVLEESGRHVMDIRLLGDDSMEKNLRGVMLGDFISQEMRTTTGNDDSREWMP